MSYDSDPNALFYLHFHFHRRWPDFVTLNASLRSKCLVHEALNIRLRALRFIQRQQESHIPSQVKNSRMLDNSIIYSLNLNTLNLKLRGTRAKF